MIEPDSKSTLHTITDYISLFCFGKMLLCSQNSYSTLVGTTFNKVCRHGVKCTALPACSVNGVLPPQQVYKKFSRECSINKRKGKVV